jgi:hypothetical protein
MERKMKMELSVIALMALMVASLAWMIIGGVGENAIPIVLFSVPLAAAIVLFGAWPAGETSGKKASSADEASGK